MSRGVTNIRSVIATGGAAGLYKPNNPGFSRHKMWYPPFNTGAGYAMGIKAGAEIHQVFLLLRSLETFLQNSLYVMYQSGLHQYL